MTSSLLRVMLCLVLSAVIPGLALGSTSTYWTGSGSSLWSDGANWDSDLPTIGYVAFIQNVANNPVRLMGSATVDGLTTGAANSLTLEGATLQVGGLLNAGTITLGGSTLTLQGSGSFLNSGTIQNATGLSQLGGNLTNTGTIAVSNNSGLQLTGGSTYTNNGQITLSAADSVSHLRLIGSGTVTLGGTGALTTTDSLSNQIFAETPGMTLVNAAGHSITGAGVIGGSGQPLAFRNEGTVTAGSSAGLIFAPDASLVNTGTIEAAGGPLQFYNGAMNTGGTIEADGSAVTFYGPAPVSGGTLNASNGGHMDFLGSAVQNANLNIASGSAATLSSGTIYTGGSIDVDGLLTLQGGTVTGAAVTNSGTIQNATSNLSQLGGTVTNTGTIAVANNSGLQLTGGSTYTNNGQITLSAADSVSHLRLIGSGTVTLGGTGALTTTDSLSNQIFAETPGMTLVNAAGHSITGAGVIGGSGQPLAFRNEGTVTAGSSAGLIFAPDASLVNTGTIEAAGGPLQFYNGAMNTGGTIEADGSAVTFYGPAPVSGGTLNASNGGHMDFLGSAVQNADLNIAAGSAATLVAGTTYTGGSIDVDGTLTLRGGTVTGAAVTNSGTIQNDVGNLSQLGGTVTNTGTIAVANNSALQLTGGSTYTNNGQITLNAAGSVSDLRLIGSGTVTLGGTGSLTTTDSLSNQIFATAPNLTLVNAAGHSITGAGVIGGGGQPLAFRNEGAVAASGSAGMVFTPSTTFQNNGVLTVADGSQTNIVGPFGNFAAQALDGGTYDVAGSLQFTGADIVKNAADVTLDGAGAHILDEAANNGLRNFSTNSGGFAMLHGASLPALGDFGNSGAVIVGSGTTLTAAGYHQTAGSTFVDGALAAPTFSLDGGTLGGSGTYVGSLTVGGDSTLTPGNSPGLLTIDGDYTQGALARMEMELGGLTRGSEYDALVVTGAMNLAGTLDVTLWGGFEPLAGSSFGILDWGSLSGTFNTIHLPTLAGGLLWDASGLYTNGTLSVSSNIQAVPVPGAAALVVFGLATIGGFLRKRM